MEGRLETIPCIGRLQMTPLGWSKTHTVFRGCKYTLNSLSHKGEYTSKRFYL